MTMTPLTAKGIQKDPGIPNCCSVQRGCETFKQFSPNPVFKADQGGPPPVVGGDDGSEGGAEEEDGSETAVGHLIKY